MAVRADHMRDDELSKSAGIQLHVIAYFIYILKDCCSLNCTSPHPAYSYFSSPPSDSDQETDNCFSPKGLIRIREDSVADNGGSQPKPQHTAQIAKFSTESLHSFSFSSTNDSEMMETRVSIITRSIDFMKHKFKGWKIPDTAFQYVPQSPSSTMTVMERYGWQTSWSTANTPRSSVDFGDELIVDRIKERERKNTNGSETSDSTSSTGDSSSSTPTNSFKPPSAFSSGPFKRKNAKLKRTLTDIPKIDPAAFTLDTLHEQPSAHPAPHIRNLHSPTRFLPQNQAILTSNSSWKILLANDIACLVFGHERSHLMGMSALDLIAPPFRERHEDILRKRTEELAAGGRPGRRAEDDDRGVVLVCGKVIPIVKDDKTTSAASLWLKEKRDDMENPIYIWIFEEIAESLVSVHINQSGVIRDLDGAVEELYGYTQEELIGNSIDVIIPAWAKLRMGDSGYYELNPDEEVEMPQRTDPLTSSSEPIPDQRLLNISEINRVKFFGSVTKFGAHFPVITKVNTPPSLAAAAESTFVVKIISIPTIASLVTIHQDGMIQSCNMVFAKYLFGFTPADLVEVKRISELLPQFPLILEKISSERSLQVGSIVNNTLCRKALLSALGGGDVGNKQKRPQLPEAFRMTTVDSLEMEEDRAPIPPVPLSWRANTMEPGSLPSIVAVHRDGTELDVQLQMRIVESAEENLYALWITFDRAAIFSKLGHPVNTDTGMIGLRSVSGTPRSGHFPTMSASFSIPSPSTSFHAAMSSVASKMKLTEPATPKFDSSSAPTSNVVLRPPTPSPALAAHPQTEACPVPVPAPPSQAELRPINIPKNIMPVTPPVAETPPANLRTYSALTDSKNINDYEIVDSLGQGAYGLVKLAYLKNDPFQKKVVVKYVVKSRILVDCWTRDRHLGLIPLEIHILHTLRRLPHQNIKYDTFCGTLDYAAPEVLQGKKYDGPPQDIWALGILLYTLIYKENPFYNIDEILARELRIPYVLCEGELRFCFSCFIIITFIIIWWYWEVSVGYNRRSKHTDQIYRLE
ncbi:hypothetical protein BC936DRAFT_140808 [Jimgerdemannia flammicorona]|uniref:Protein kinase domain-containing protein n=1 Tax=Jimgerdemannia flammicorona TaxID=994334 RepID=A0A433DGL0_9FUNG|nr:hypothetical protein BC936DRAFT_140808 [Jimgerdemannia flammicorona]